LTAKISSAWNRAQYAIYALALAVSISTWFIAIHAPLGLDETGTYWQISDGFSGIWQRGQNSLVFPAYPYILWLSTKLIGASEIALRVPSIIAMFGAAYLLYLAAREFFERDLAIIASVIFCIHPIVIFASIDIRPYAFGILAVNAAIYILLRLKRSDSNSLLALFGLTAACIVWFHYLFIDILPALAFCFFAVKNCDRKKAWRQMSLALAAFALALLPAIPGLMSLFRTSKTHVYESAPNVFDLARTFMPGRFFYILFGTAFIAFLVLASRQRPFLAKALEGRQILLCTSLALVPIVILYGVSVGTSIHTFATRHRLDAIPGIALCWVLLLNRFYPRTVRLLFCTALVATTAFGYFSSPKSRLREPSLKYAVEVAGKNAAVDDAPVLMCSGFVESNYVAMPSIETVKDSPYFAPLSYYRLSGTVVPLPQRFNDQTIQIGTRFLSDATQIHQRFLVVGHHVDCYKTLDWFTQNAAATHSVREVGVFDGVEVLEFTPRNEVPPGAVNPSPHNHGGER
jgi:hypothetical protein